MCCLSNCLLGLQGLDMVCGGMCAYLSHATLHNLQACLRLQEVFF